MNTILNTVRKIAAKDLAPRAEMIDKTGKWPEESLRSLQKAGLGGLVIPAKYGGHGYGLYEVAKVCELLGRECASTAMCFGMHLVGSAVLAAKATPDQQERFLQPIIEGKHLTTLSLSEPGTGSKLYIPESRLEKKREGYQLNGTKSFVTNGGYADSYVVSAVIPNPDTPVGKFSCILVPNSTDGLEWSPGWEGMGLRGNSSRNMEMNNLFLPEENLLGEQGDQIWYVFEVILPYFITAMASTYIGIAAAALDEAIHHVKKRSHTHSGSALASYTILQHRIGTLWSEVERTRQLIYSAASKGDTGETGAVLSLMAAKAEVAECVVHVVNEAMTLMGGIAYADNGKMSRLLRDARASHIMAPTTDMLRTWIGRTLLDIPILGE